MSFSPTVTLSPESGGRTTRDKLPYLIYGALGAVGVWLGLSQAIGGAYDESTWSPIALAVLALLLALAIGAPRKPPLAAASALLGLALWSLVSSGWGDSTEAARIAADRWLLYAAALAVLVWVLAGDRRRAKVLIASAAVGVLMVTAWILLRLLERRGASLFIGTRLNDPLGYVNGQAGYLLAGVWPCCALAERRRPAPPAAWGWARWSRSSGSAR